MTKNDIIEKMYINNDFDKLIRTLIYQQDMINIDDIKQELILVLLERPDSHIIDLYNKDELFLYCYGILSNQIRGSILNSPYHRKYTHTIRGHSKYEDFREDDSDSFMDTIEYDEDDSIEIKKMIEQRLFQVNQITDKLIPHKKIMFDMYYKLNEFNVIDGIFRDLDDLKRGMSSYRRMSILLGCSRSTINKNVRYIVDNLVKELGDGSTKGIDVLR